MGYIGKREEYRGLYLKFWKDVWGYYSVTIEAYRKDGNFNFYDYYYVNRINTYEKIKDNARTIAHKEMDKMLDKLKTMR